MNTLPILMVVAGGLLIYSAVKNKSPIEVIKETLSGSYGSDGNVSVPKATRPTKAGEK